MTKENAVQHFDQYVKLIESGDIVVGEYVKLAIERVKRYKNQYKFDQNKANAGIAFIENECSNTKGVKGLLKLALPQKVWLETAWGFYKTVELERTDPDTMKTYTATEERRLVNEIPLMEGRGGGKTTLAAAIGSKLQIADGEYGADVQLLASTREQAGYLYNANRAMLNFEESLMYTLSQKDLLSSTKQGILFRPSNSLMAIKTADYETLDGTNAHGNIFDEVHAYKEDFIDIVNTGSKRKRANWQTWYITTNGQVREKVFDRYFKLWVSILRGEIDNDSVMPWLYTLDSQEEIHNPNTWQKAMPMLGIIAGLTKDAISRDIEMAKDDPIAQAELMAKTFNLPINNYLAYFTNAECEGNSEAFRPELFSGNEDRSARVILGIDLSDVNDICSISMMIPVGDDRYFKSLKFLPRATVDALPKETADKYLEWEAGGYIHLHEKEYNDPEYIFGFMREFFREHHILPVAAGYDRWGAREIKRLFEDTYGDITYEVPQTVKVLSNPLKVYKTKAKAGRIIFNDPVATWCHMNVNVKIDANQNIFPNKQKATGKIDVFASMLDAYIAFEDDKEILGYYFD